MDKQRPVFLNLMQIRLPIPAIASILHRISGIILFISLPFLLWGLQASLSGPQGFASMQTCVGHCTTKIAIWALVSVVFYHLLAGTRHLIMDLGFGESLKAARVSAMLVILSAIAMSIITGAWLW